MPVRDDTTRSWRRTFAVLAAFGLCATLAAAVRAHLGERSASARTRATLSGIASGAQRYFREHGALPASFAELPEVSTVDAWSRELQLIVGGDLLAVRSAGSDGCFGDAGDLTLLVHADDLRREMTLERLARINATIVLYNAERQLTDPLPADVERLLEILSEERLLGRDPELERDAWGSPFVEDPPGVSPAVRVRSVHVGPGGRLVGTRLAARR